ncbi:MAG: hypothetical protein HRT45_04930 [Bdellovibrionales bacterium]|nr:hypothetical protein [Bdellovibrionales bacterium]
MTKGLLTTLLATMTLMAASANAATYHCENGTFDEKGDGYFSLEMTSDGIDFRPYESSFTVPVNSILMLGSTMIIANKELKYWAEGDEYTMVVDAMLNYEEGALEQSEFTMNLTYSTDKGYFRSHELNCVQPQE